MPSRPKRLIVSTALLVTALLLHFNFCSWVFGDPVANTSVVAALPVSLSAKVEYYGVVARYPTSFPVASIVGPVIPVNMILLIAYLSVHWREQASSRAKS